MGKNAPGDAKNGPAGVKSEHRWTKIGPPRATFVHFGSTFGHLRRSFTQFYAFLWGFREQMCNLSEKSWKSQKNQASCLKIHEYCTKPQKKSLQVCNSEPRKAKNGAGGVKRERGWTKMGPPGATLPTLEALLATWGVPLRIFTHFIRFSWTIVHFFWKLMKIPEKSGNLP